MMKKQTFLWVIVLLIGGIFLMPKTAFTRDDRNYDHRLEGRWYLNGDPNKPTDIHPDRRGLEAKNENGDTSRLEIDRNGNIHAIDWNGIRGRVRDNRIEWDNGTTWTRRASDRVGRR